jgi:hypothetical protein
LSSSFPLKISFGTLTNNSAAESVAVLVCERSRGLVLGDASYGRLNCLVVPDWNFDKRFPWWDPFQFVNESVLGHPRGVLKKKQRL